jgi:hypothetical protein
MSCRCSDRNALLFDERGALYHCVDCDMDHRLCGSIKTMLVCGELEDHKGLHKSISTNIEWN